MADVSFRVLGPLEVVVGGRVLELGSHLQRTLFALLLARPNEVVSTDRLVDSLWETPPALGVHSVQTYVSNLRRLFREAGAGTTIETRRPGYALRVDPDNVDSLRFERLLAEARSAEDEKALSLLETALEMWRGPAYAEFADREAFHIEALRLDELRVLAIELRLHHLLKMGRLDEAIPELNALTASQPLRERPRALTMEALYRSGRKPEALRVYTDYRKLLEDELGLEPSKELQDLELAILRDEMEESPPQPPAVVTLHMPAMTFERFGRAPNETVIYSVFGDGPLVVKPQGWFSSLDLVAAGLDYGRSAMFARLAEDFRLITYDRYGVGLSRGPITDFSHEASVTELVGLMELLDLRDVTLFGESAAGSIVIAATAAVPQRVSRLVLMGCCASAPSLYDKGIREHLVPIVRNSWGLGSSWLTSLDFPGADAQVHDADARLQRRSATSEVAAGYLEQFLDTDVAHLLPEIEIPALILHYRGDRSIPFEGARQLALGLPNAKLIPLEGNTHTPPPQDVERVATLVANFVSAT